MAPKKSWLFGRPPLPSSRLLNAPTSGSAPIPPIPIPGPLAPQHPGSLQRAYPDYVNGRASRLASDATLAVASMLNDIPSLPLAIAGPLAQIVDVVSGTIEAIKLMRQNKDECLHLITRVVNFLQSLVDEWRTSNVPIFDGSPTAARLFALRLYVFYQCLTFSLPMSSGSRNLMTIKDDATEWSRLSIWDSLIKRDRIKVAISRHGDNLTDCLSSFQVSIHDVTVLVR